VEGAFGARVMGSTTSISAITGDDGVMSLAIYQPGN